MERVGEGLIWQPMSCNLPNQLRNHKDLHCLNPSHHLCKIVETPCILTGSMVCLYTSCTQNLFIWSQNKKHSLCYCSQCVKQWNITDNMGALTSSCFLSCCLCLSGSGHVLFGLMDCCSAGPTSGERSEQRWGGGHAEDLCCGLLLLDLHQTLLLDMWLQPDGICLGAGF